MVRMDKPLHVFYTEVMNCPATQEQCPHAWKDPAEGMVPRGFKTPETTPVDLLIVGKNPGHPLSWETNYYRKRSGSDLLNAWTAFLNEFERQVMENPDASLRFHRNLRRYVRYLLGVTPSVEPYKRVVDGTWFTPDIRDRVAFTNLFKCSTRNEQQSLTAKAFMPCYQRFFRKELALLKPRVVLALGSEVAKFLRKMAKSGDSLPVVIQIKHPSYFYNKKDEGCILETIRQEITRALSREAA